MNQPRTILLLGSTGSIGTQALEIVRDNPDMFTIVGLAAGGSSQHSIDVLCDQIQEFGITNVAVANKDAAQQVTDRTGVAVLEGPDAATRLVKEVPAHTVLNGMVGSLGLGPTLATIEVGETLALANKESLVAGGELVMARAKPGQIVPVDSEHSAFAQCLRSGKLEEVAKLVLTASGGPFRGWKRDDLWPVTPAQAAAHPTWNMGEMNTLNSATLVNKGLELIEAHLLFGVSYDNIEVAVHPQSIVHSMVTFCDGSTIAQASPPSMKIPISLGMLWPDRVPNAAPACDFTQSHEWTFEPLDNEVFPAVELARQAGRAGGTMTAVYNAANEEAAAAFLAGKLRFPEIVDTVADVLNDADQWRAQPQTVEDVLATEDWARARAHDLLREK
ncbi:MAG: 1-deoxy-D-xylulose-5-phosphate reductoisomerase [Lawsonella sp.]